jgi:CDGSH-type Zn-finger protein/uncharacterized Fe-S cluster protein YjdI
MTIHKYPGTGITITYDARRCIHAAECARGLPAVFDSQRRPWIAPDAGEPRLIAETISRCPTGALHFQALDAALDEKAADENVMRLSPDGPLYLRGQIEIDKEEGGMLVSDTRAALCRCGSSENKPFCDGAHSKISFSDAGVPGPSADGGEAAGAGVDGDVLKISPRLHGPLHLQGKVTIEDARGAVIFRGNDAWLCRCGGSKNKPFCDGTHKAIGFRSSDREGFPASRTKS